MPTDPDLERALDHPPGSPENLRGLAQYLLRTTLSDPGLGAESRMAVGMMLGAVSAALGMLAKAEPFFPTAPESRRVDPR